MFRVLGELEDPVECRRHVGTAAGNRRRGGYRQRSLPAGRILFDQAGSSQNQESEAPFAFLAPSWPQG